MSYLIGATFAAFAIGAMLLYMSRKGYLNFDEPLGWLGCFFLCLALVGTLVVLTKGYAWVAADVQARVINREFSTAYTREELFYAKDVIETVRKIQRQRVDVSVTDKQEAQK